MSEEAFFEQCLNHLLETGFGDKCSLCGRYAPLRCSQCKVTRYCGEKCQKQHWKNGHKKNCFMYSSEVRKVIKESTFTHTCKYQPDADGLLKNDIQTTEKLMSTESNVLNQSGLLIETDSFSLSSYRKNSKHCFTDSKSSNNKSTTDNFETSENKAWINPYNSYSSDSVHLDGGFSETELSLTETKSDFGELSMEKKVHIVSNNSDNDDLDLLDDKPDTVFMVTSSLYTFSPDINLCSERVQKNIDCETIKSAERLSHTFQHEYDKTIERQAKKKLNFVQDFSKKTRKSKDIVKGKKIICLTQSSKKKAKIKSHSSMVEIVKNSQKYVDVLSSLGEENASKNMAPTCDNKATQSAHSKNYRSESEMDTDSPIHFEQPTQNEMSKLVISMTDVKRTDNDIYNLFECSKCNTSKSCNELIQCCFGHVLCEKCMQTQVKDILAKSKQTQIKCPAEFCDSFIPLDEAKKIFPSILIELLQEMFDKECLESIKRCPDCGLPVEMDPETMEFHCPNQDCMLICCRYCKKPVNERDHRYCNPMLSSTTALSSVDGLPQHWAPMTEKDTDYICVTLHHESEEYFTVLKRFCETMLPDRVASIKRIQNPRLWQKYLLTRKHKMEDFGEENLNERLLFHGSKVEKIGIICKEGFDWRVCGEHGTAFGQGTYFARDAHYSAYYSSGPTVPPPTSTNAFPLPPSLTSEIRTPSSQLMICARVLCGRMTLGNRNMRRPPPDFSDRKLRPFDSAVNNVNNPSIFVMFESSQTYPEYVLEYL